ncbi:hypothetical protein DW644_11120 [Clostridiales bacterium AM23-16LB]|nr:hypothetical protein DW644_11120 [Clostridiales bacterium AM23-16LB]
MLMKKKQIYALITATVLMATSITGCSGKTTEETAVEETAETEEAPEEEAVEEPVYETRQYTVEVATANEDGTFTAYDTDGKQYILTLATELSDDEKALVVPEACLIVSTEVQVGTKLVVNGEEVSTTEEDAEENADTEVATEENTEESADSADENLATGEDAEKSEGEEVATEEPITITVTAVEALDDEVQAATLATVTFKAINGFSVEDLGDTTMYAKQSVNVRKGPSSDYEQLGSLSSGQEVTVTGIADSGWYRIKYNDEDGYCSNNYLQTEKPAPKAAASSNSGSASSAGTQVAQADTGASAPAAASGRDFKAEYDAAMRAGDIDRAAQIMQEIDGISVGGGISGGGSSSGSSSSGGSSSSSSSERSVSTSADFVNYLNQKRAEEGLGELSWSDSMASTATERASEIVDNFSHSGMRNCNAEIILQSGSGSDSSWYNQFYNSSGHRANMMDDLWGSAAAAYCKVGNKYYVIVMFDL